MNLIEALKQDGDKVWHPRGFRTKNCTYDSGFFQKSTLQNLIGNLSLYDLLSDDWNTEMPKKKKAVVMYQWVRKWSDGGYTITEHTTRNGSLEGFAKRLEHTRLEIEVDDET